MSDRKEKPTGKESKTFIDPDKVAENPGLLPYAHNVGSIQIRPEDAGKIKGRALTAMGEQTHRQMDQIKGQIHTLANQAKELQQRVEVSERIYEAQINFEPIPGKTYHVYEKEDGATMLSLVSPDEWGRKKPFKKYISTVQMLADHTWEVLHYNED